MLSVKVWTGDQEYLKECERTVFFSANEDGPAYLRIIFRNGDSEDIRNGFVYVMNDNGRTIAEYSIALN